MKRTYFCAVAALLLAGAVAGWSQGAQTPAPDTPKAVIGNGPNPNVREKKDKSRIRDVKGVVRDDRDNPVEGALVTIRNVENGKTITWRTGRDGSYVFHDCSMDSDYELTATHDQLGASAKRKLSQYDTRKPATMNLQLQRKNSA